MTHIARTRGPTSTSTRSRISCAALFVKVIARISPGRALPVRIRWAMRCVSTRVLPDPAPASTNNGPVSCSTAWRWGSFRPSRRGSAAAGALTQARVALHSARPMGLCDRVRESCARIAESARFVTIAPASLDRIEPGPPPVLDPERHYLEGSREDVATYLLTLDAINFG